MYITLISVHVRNKQHHADKQLNGKIYIKKVSKQKTKQKQKCRMFFVHATIMMVERF